MTSTVNGGSFGGACSCSSDDSSLPHAGVPSMLLPVLTSQESSPVARCRRIYAHAHDYIINSISTNRSHGQDTSGAKSFFTDITASISDIKFGNDGRHILSRDYMNLKLWDINMDSGPAATFQVHEHLRPNNRTRNQSMGGGYSQQGYQSRPPSNWASAGAPPKQSGYGYMQPGAYPGQIQQFNMPQPSYGGYPQQTPGGYPSNWEQSGQQTSQTYDYYSQAPAQEQPTPGVSAAPTDNSGYNYSQPPASGYNQQGQGYSQDGYGGYSQSAHGQPQYDQQSYGSAHGYGSAVNPTQDGHNASCGT